MSIRSRPWAQRVIEAGEAQLDRIVQRILKNERFVAAVQGIVARSVSAKDNLDKSLQSALATMNLPSTADIEELRRRLDELDRSLVELHGVVAKLGPSAMAAGAKSRAASSPTSKRATASRAKAASGAKAPTRAKAGAAKAGATKAPATKKQNDASKPGARTAKKSES